MDVKILGFTAANPDAVRDAWEGLDLTVRRAGAMPVRHWQAGPHGYLVIEGSPATSEIRTRTAGIAVDVVGLYEVTELVGGETNDLPETLSQEIRLPDVNPDQLWDVELHHCPGCARRLPLERHEHQPTCMFYRSTG